MTPIAAVVLAHADPEHVRRLVFALEDTPVFLHCDARTASPVYQRMIDALPPRVILCDRLRTTLASWSLVEAELAALRAAIAKTNARHIAVVSGADYPLLSMQELSEDLEKWEGSSWLWNVPLPFSLWNTDRHPDGGLWRVRRRFLTWRDQVAFCRGVPLRWPVNREVPQGLELRASSQWKIYARHHVEILLDLVDQRPDIIRFWRSTLVPDETFVASVLGSTTLCGSQALPVCYEHPWYIDWRGVSPGHPKWLTRADFDRLAQARWAEPSRPATAFAVTAAADRRPRRKLFARKFSTSIDSDVLDRIDSELRG